MYLEIDLAGPISSAFLTNTKTRNLLLNTPVEKRWPTKWIGTDEGPIEVFDKFYIYRNDSVQYVHNLYKVLGMKRTDITRTEDLSKVQDLWLDIKPIEILEVDETGAEIPRIPITAEEVAEYVNERSVLNEEVEIEVLYTQVVASQKVRSYMYQVDDEPTVLSKEQVLAMIEGGYESTYPVPIIENVASANGTVAHESYNKFIGFDTDTSAVAFASLMDTEDEVFSSSTKIVTYSVTRAQSNKWDGEDVTSLTLSVTASYKFTQTRDALPTDDIIVYMTDKANTETRLSGMSMYKQLGAMVRVLRPLTDGSLFKTISVTEYDYDGEPVEVITRYVRVGTDPIPQILVDNPAYDPVLEDTGTDGANPSRLVQQARVDGTGMRGLKKSSFNALFARMVETDYTLKPVKRKWYSGLLTMVIIVVAVVIAALSAGALAPVSAAAVAAGTATVAATATFMTALALTLTLSVVAVGALARATAGRSSSFSMAMGNAMVTLSVIAEVVGIVATILTIINLAQAARMAIGNQLQGEAGRQAATTAVQDASIEMVEEATEEAIQTAIKESALKAFQDATVGEIIQAAATVVYESVKASVVSAGSNIVSAFNGSLFTNMSTSEILTGVLDGLNVATKLFMAVSPRNDPSEPVPLPDEIPYVPDKIEMGDLIQAGFDDGSMYEPMQTSQMCDNMIGGTIRRKFDQCYLNEFP